MEDPYIRQQTLLGNVANNLIAFGNRTQAVSPADALSKMRKSNLVDTLAMRRAEREDLATEIARKKQELARTTYADKVTREAQIRNIMSYAQQSHLSAPETYQLLSKVGGDEGAKASKEFYAMMTGKPITRHTGEDTAQDYSVDPITGEQGDVGAEYKTRGEGQTINVGAKIPPSIVTTTKEFYGDPSTEINAINRLVTINDQLDKQGDSVTGFQGRVRGALANIGNMFGLKNSESMDSAQLVTALFSAEAGSLRKEIVGTGAVSNFEQQLLKQASGGGIAGARAAKALISISLKNKLNNIKAKNKRLSSIYTEYPVLEAVFPPIDVPEVDSLEGMSKEEILDWVNSAGKLAGEGTGKPLSLEDRLKKYPESK